VLWNNSADVFGADVFGGAAGIGLVLLRAARALGDPALLDLAADAGVGLIDGGHFRVARLPNFSHGAAGVSYFLATLFRDTRDVRFKAAALAGAESLLAVADTRDAGCLVHHHVPGPGEPALHYLGWCHGPAGTARLFHRLSQITGDAAWTDRVRSCARSIAVSGIPEREAPGLWNNAGQCCGLAGVADFFFALHRATGSGEDRDFAERVARHVLARGERTAGGLRWTHAEHRKRPDDLEAQAGYMQGAAGIGAMCLHADACAHGRAPSITFPDSPW
jgi:lantibiotic modifying enzyme